MRAIWGAETPGTYLLGERYPRGFVKKWGRGTALFPMRGEKTNPSLARWMAAKSKRKGKGV